MTLKYVIFPGNGRGSPDGRYGFIPSLALIALYGVSPDECLIVSKADPEDVRAERIAKATKMGLRLLGPSVFGKYPPPADDCS